MLHDGGALIGGGPLRSQGLEAADRAARHGRRTVHGLWRPAPECGVAAPRWSSRGLWSQRDRHEFCTFGRCGDATIGGNGMQASDEMNGSVGKGGRVRWGIGLVSCLAIALASCAIPGQLYRVSPPITGTLDDIPADSEAVELVFSVMHRENPELFEVQRVGLSEGRHFYFEPVAMEIAGQEYSKFYRVFLHYRDGDQDQLIWRAEFSRRDLTGRVQLDCALDRPVRVSQPCLVREPLQQPWLVAEGQRTFRRLCSGCHGAPETGVAAPHPRAPDLSEIAQRRGGRFDRLEIARRIEGGETPPEHGTGEMPVWGNRLSAEYWRYTSPDRLVGATLDPIVVYLESLQRAEGAAQPPRVPKGS